MSMAMGLTGRRKLSPGEIGVVLDAHERFVSGRAGGKRAVLKFVDLTGFDLSGRNLSDSDLSASILDGAKLVRTRLERASLFGSDLRKADLRGAILIRADLRGACLRGANLSQADLTQADFRVGQIATPHPSKGLASLTHQQRYGELDNANFAGATLSGSQMEEASVFASDFADCTLTGAKLARANFKDANLSGAILDGADLNGANLEGADLSYSVADVDLRCARTSGSTDLTGMIAAPTAEAMARAPSLLAQARGNHEWCRTGQGRPACFDGEDLRPLARSLRGLRLSAVSARRAVMVGLDLAGAHLQGANLEGADLRSANLRGADLRGARLAGANLTKADLAQAQLSPLPLGGGRQTSSVLEKARFRYSLAQAADFTDAQMCGADLRGCDLTGAVLRGAVLAGAELDSVIGLESALAA